jgi:hypothetical protein
MSFRKAALTALAAVKGALALAAEGKPTLEVSSRSVAGGSESRS